MPLKTLEWTYVLYEDTSLDKISALLNFAPFIVFFTFGATAYVRRCVETSFLLMGLLSSTIVNGIIKNIIKEPRPIGINLFVIRNYICVLV
jgi:hypothetical protein